MVGNEEKKRRAEKWRLFSPNTSGLADLIDLIDCFLMRDGKRG